MNFKQISKQALEIRKLYDQYNKDRTGKSWTGKELMEGFVGDVGDLMKIIMAKEGIREMDNIDQKLKHELSDCLWSVIVLADKYNIDLEESFMKTMNELEKRIKG